MKKNHYKTLAIIALLSCSSQLHAQLDSCNVFLKGNFVEVGINWNGAYGSSVAAPSGFHPKGPAGIANSATCGGACYSGGQNLGFVADPDMDGWSTGSPYSYYGDYFLPGSPQEGWSIESNGVEADVYNGAGCGVTFPSGVSGANTAYLTSGAFRRGVWKGTFDSLEITQVTSLDTTSTYFIVHVRIKNMGHVGRNVYYMRTLDPDNAEAESGNFGTKNKVDFQLPNPSNKVLLSTWGLSAAASPIPNAFLGLGTIDTAAKCFIVKAGLTPDASVKLDSLYWGYGGRGDTLHNRFSDSATNDVAIGLVFNVGHLLPIDSATIAYAYAFRRADADSALAATTKPFPLDVADTGTFVNSVNNHQNNISIYPNPFTNQSTISNLSSGDQLTIYNMMGSKVVTVLIASDGKYICNTANLQQGMYIIRVLDKYGNVKANLPVQKL